MSKNNTNQQEARNGPIAGSKRLVIDECVYQIRPIYDLYAASRDGKIIHIVKQIPNIGAKQQNGYMRCMVRKYGHKNQKGYFVHRFVWECYSGFIFDGKVIDHISDNKEDNRLFNLQLLTQQKNCKKSAQNVTIPSQPIIIKIGGV